MLKLYKRIKRVLHYHEAWARGGKVIEHWGKVGEHGKSTEHHRNKKLSAAKDVHQVLAQAMVDGYRPIDYEDHAVLLIEYDVDGMGTDKDLKKRQALQDRMDELLGWTGLGMCDGGSIGSGTMEVCCFVVDFKIAKRVIEESLKDTKFGDYTRIYDEDNDPPPDLTEGPTMFVPPWLMHAGMDQKNKSWQSGKPAEYLAQWVAWYQTLPATSRSGYATLFSEPKGWSGFYQSVASQVDRA